MRLNKLALVTGAASGFGAEIAGFSPRGAFVAVVDSTKPKRSF